MDIQWAVGAWEKGARNDRKDVETVQTVLTRAARLLGWPDVDPQGVDGSIARPPRKSGTVAAIKAFQVQSGLETSGVLAPGSDDWRRLVVAVETAPAPPGGDSFFPFAKPAVADWTHPPRSFGSRRSGGRRAHAGCDLYAPVGRLIHAVRDGVVIRAVCAEPLTRYFDARFRDPVSTAMVRKLQVLDVKSPIQALLPVFDAGHVAIVMVGPRGRARGVVRLGAAPSLAMSFVPALLGRVREAAPEFVLEDFLAGKLTPVRKALP